MFFVLAMTSSTRWVYFAKGLLEGCAMRAECCSVIMVPTSPTRPGPSPGYFEENLHLSEKTCLRKSLAWEKQLKHSSHLQLIKRARCHRISSTYVLTVKNWCINMSYWISTNFRTKFLCQKSENGKKQWCDIEVIYCTLYRLNFQSNWKFVIMTHHNTKLQLGGRKNIYKNIYADTTSKFASIRLLARWSGSVYKLMFHHWLVWFVVYVIIRYV